MNLTKYLNPRKGLSNSQVQETIKKMNLVGENKRLFLPNVNLISKPGDILNFFPHLLELIGNINDSAKKAVAEQKAKDEAAAKKAADEKAAQAAKAAEAPGTTSQQ